MSLKFDIQGELLGIVPVPLAAPRMVNQAGAGTETGVLGITGTGLRKVRSRRCLPRTVIMLRRSGATMLPGCHYLFVGFVVHCERGKGLSSCPCQVQTVSRPSCQCTFERDGRFGETMKIIADANMPGLEPFEALGRVEQHEGRRLRREQLVDADVLLVRSVTRVDQALLSDTRVRFVGSATIGTDHIDQAWLASQGIMFAHAPGCNARAVAEYVLQSVLLLCKKRQCSPVGLSAGIVGMGNVGGRVVDWLRALGMTIRVCDPLLARKGVAGLGTIDEVLECDVVTLHVPLTEAGEDATVHLLDSKRLRAMRNNQMLINTCRGAVVDNQALLALLEQGKGPMTILDVWESEPVVPEALYRQVQYGSPHIAGYSVEGKLKGTEMLHGALCDWLQVAPAARANVLSKPFMDLPVSSEDDLLSLLQAAYDLREDHRRLGDSLEQADPAAAFDRLRKDYPLRHELHHWQPRGAVDPQWQPILSRLFVTA